ncbi:inactive tyrosine-protein kinase PEAK1-like isoform X2 [Chaetodon trifascialis]|uniref:inactive tyrosine-protein kinase PEAK1-like isoform X2 n=1 Tax=Chaetodon trifascialis TaxID=109706 RepID=UPI0039939DA8
MASGPSSGAEEQPPALPVKQHRSRSFRGSSVGSDCDMLSPVGLQHQNYSCNDVFPEPTDCHAAQCPIHQRYDPSRHQPHNFDNPLYMLAPTPNTYFQEETEEFKPVRGSPVPLPSFSQLSFDTPDEHLQYLFSSFDDQRAVFQGIQHRHLLFLKSMAQSVDAGILLQGATERDVSSYQPQDFLLCEGNEPKQIGDAVYCSLHSPKFPGRVLGLRVHKQTDEASSAPTKHQSSHVNVQDVIAHFQPSNTPRNDSSMLQAQNPPHPFKPGCIAAKPPGGGSTEYDHMNLPSAQSFLMRGHSVSIERDLPHATLEDFVQDSSSLQSTDCLDYDRQVCVLLLQILKGSQHLHNIGTSVADLRPREIFLVWPNRRREEGGNKLEQDASEMKTSRLKGEMEWEKTERKGQIQMLWRTHGSPRVLLTPLSSALSVPHPHVYIKSQIGALVQYCLHSRESLTSLGSVPTLSKSSYRRGLLHLASLLQSESSGPQMADMVAMLQVLLWGPHVPLFDHRRPMTTTVHHWLTIKRALLVMKLAERGLIQDQSALDWEDCMCLQYLSFTDSEAVVSVSSPLWLTLNVD